MTTNQPNSQAFATAAAIADAQRAATEAERARCLRAAHRFMEFSVQVGDASAFACAREIAFEIEDGGKPNSLTFGRLVERVKESVDVYHASRRSAG